MAIKLAPITAGPKAYDRRACIRGSPFPVSRLLGLPAAGETQQAIVEAYPYLEPEDIPGAPRYAAHLTEEETAEISS
jgi:uncharacterized protein (DUF433 family)